MNANPKSRRLAVAMALALLASTLEAYLPIHTVQAATASQVAVTASVLNVRAGPGTHYAIITKVLRNTRLTMQKQQAGWLQVRLPNGRSGWVSGQYVRPVSASPAPSSGSSAQPAAPSSQTVAVTASVLNVRSGPGTTYAIVTKVKRDTRLTVQKQQAGWLQVRLPNGRTGWVSAQYVRPVSTTPAPPSGSSAQPAAPSSQTVAVTASVLNVRSGPGTTYAIVTKVKRDTRLTVQKQQAGWLQVRLPNGRTGWVSAQYVRPVGASPAPSSGSSAQPAAPSSQTVAVTASVLNVRSGPGTTYTIVTKVKRDTRLTVQKKQAGWLQVRLPNGRTGWVSAQYVRPVGASPAPSSGSSAQPAAPSSQTVAVTASVLNVRSGPGTNYAIVTKVKRDTRLTVQKKQAGWLQVRLPNGRTGWVSAQYVRPVGASPAPSSGSSAQPAAPSSQTVAVTASVLNVRSGPGTNYAIISQVKRNTRLTVQKKQAGWLQVRLPNGRTGWVSAQYVRPVHPTAPSQGSAKQPPAGGTSATAKTATVTASSLNVRSGPGTQYAVIRSIPKGTRVTVLEQLGSWWRVQAGNLIGWVASAYLRVETSTSILPAPSPPPAPATPKPQPISAPGTEPPPASNDPQAILRGKRIILDPGHGGQDPGAIGRTLGTLEKTVNLQVAHLVKARLEDLGAEVFMTREDDRYPTLAERVAFARKVQGDVFISIHHNSALDQTLRGTMTFYAKDGPSRLLAEAVHEELVRAIGLRDLQVRRANYYVIVNNPYPAILLEIGFLSHPDEERLVRDPEFQARAAQGIVQGLIRYFALSPNSQPDLARVAYSSTP